MPALSGVLETVLYVADLGLARRFYDEVMGLPVIFEDHRMCACDVGGRGVLLLFRAGESLQTVPAPGGAIPPHDGSGPVHVAFAIPAEALGEWEGHLEAAGVAIESRAVWPRGGTSLYFRDPDAHLLELATPGLWPGY
jgi:catechol 2,3-dioxygenase-like lactoylglutathione lyase family enzyme